MTIRSGLPAAAALLALISIAARAETLQFTPRAGEPLQLTILRARMEARRRRMDATSAPRPRDMTYPVITSGKIITPNISTDRPPAAPAISLQYDTKGAGLGGINVTMVSPSGKQFLFLYSEFAPGLKPDSGSIVLQQPLGFTGNSGEEDSGSEGALSFYSEPGTWSVYALVIGDQGHDVSVYEAPYADTVLTRSTFEVSNPGTPDMKPPKTESGRLLTRSVSLSSATPYLKALVNVSDNASGINYVGFVLIPPAGSYPDYLFALSNLTRPVESGAISIVGDLKGLPTGTWTIYNYFACDVASNCVQDTSPADIKALLGATSFEVTP